MMPSPPPAPSRPDLGHGEVPPSGDEDVPWRWWNALLLYLLGFLVLGSAIGIVIVIAFGGDLTEGTGLGLPTIVASGVADAVFAAVMVGWLRSRALRWQGLVRLVRGRQGLRDLVVGLGAGVILYPAVSVGIGAILLILFRLATGETVTAPEQLSPDLTTGAKVIAGIFALGIAPVVEELFFRGILFRSLRRHGFWTAAIASSVAFGLVHYVGGPAADAAFLMIATAFTGLGLAFVYEWRGLSASVGTHLAFNAIGVLLIFTIR